MSDDRGMNRPKSALEAAFAETCLITMEQAAKLLGIDRKTLRLHMNNGELGSRIVGAGTSRPRHRFGQDDILAFLERMKVKRTLSCVPPGKAAHLPRYDRHKIVVPDFNGPPPSPLPTKPSRARR